MKTDLAALKPRIVDVLRDHGMTGTLPTRDGWAKVKCPYHDDSNASASLHLTQYVFTCHGCGIRGDVFALVRERDNVDFKTALALVENKYGNGVPATPDTRYTRTRPTRTRARVRL